MSQRFFAIISQQKKKEKKSYSYSYSRSTIIIKLSHHVQFRKIKTSSKFLNRICHKYSSPCSISQQEWKNLSTKILLYSILQQRWKKSRQNPWIFDCQQIFFAMFNFTTKMKKESSIKILHYIQFCNKDENSWKISCHIQFRNKDEKSERFYTILNFATKMKKARAKSLNPWLSTNILRHVQFLNKDEKKAGKILESYLSTNILHFQYTYSIS